MKLLLFLILFLTQLTFAQSIEELLSIYPVKAIDEAHNIQEITDDQIKELLTKNKGQVYPQSLTDFVIKKVDQLPHGATARFNLEINQAGHIEQQLFVTRNFYKSISSINDLNGFSKRIMQFENQMVEIITNGRLNFNAALGSAAVLHNYEPHFFKFSDKNSPYTLPEQDKLVFKQALEEKFGVATQKYLRLTEAEYKLSHQYLENKIANFDWAEKTPAKLKELVANGDRKGAVAILREYIPFEMMGPVERKKWQTWLEVMENPAPMKDRILILRGLEEGQYFSNAKEEMYLLSNFFTHQEGIKTENLSDFKLLMSEGNMSMPNGLINKTLQVNSARYSTHITSHGLNPVSSPLISFTSSPKIAHRFSKKGIGVFAVDPRIVSLNGTNLYGEFEILGTLFTFPDEFVLFLDHDKQIYGEMNRVMREAIVAKLGDKANALLTKSGMDIFSDLPEENVIPKNVARTKTFNESANKSFGGFIQNFKIPCDQHFQ